MLFFLFFGSNETNYQHYLHRCVSIDEEQERKKKKERFSFSLFDTIFDVIKDKYESNPASFCCTLIGYNLVFFGVLRPSADEDERRSTMAKDI